MTRNEILDANVIDDDSSLRPSSFDEYVGQTNLKENLKVFVGAAKLVTNHSIMCYCTGLLD